MHGPLILKDGPSGSAIHYSDRSNDRIQEDVLVVPGSVPHGEAFERLLFDERAFRGCKT